MNDLLKKIQGCKNCPLYQNMNQSPILPEWKGELKNCPMFILGSNISNENNLYVETISGINRIGLLKILKNLDSYYITNLIKCATKTTYTKKQIQTCAEWINQEILEIQPAFIIGFGKKVSEYIKLDYEFPAINNVIASKKKIKQLQEIIYN